MDWLPWFMGGAFAVLYGAPIGHTLFRRKFGYRCPRCQGRCQFSGRSFGFMELNCNVFTCKSCNQKLRESFGRLISE